MAWDDFLDVFLDNDYRQTVLGGLRHERPVLYRALLIGIVLVLALAVYVLLY